MTDREILNELIQISLEEPLLGECHTSTFIERNGLIFRYGITDDDVAEQKGLWVRIINPRVHLPIYKWGE